MVARLDAHGRLTLQPDGGRGRCPLVRLSACPLVPGTAWCCCSVRVHRRARAAATFAFSKFDVL